jgi:hypothetical protein
MVGRGVSWSKLLGAIGILHVLAASREKQIKVTAALTAVRTPDPRQGQPRTNKRQCGTAAAHLRGVFAKAQPGTEQYRKLDM